MNGELKSQKLASGGEARPPDARVINPIYPNTLFTIGQFFEIFMKEFSKNWLLYDNLEV